MSELGHDSDLWQVTLTEDGVTRKLPDKLRGIAMDNELAGERTSNGEDVTVVVKIGDPDKDRAPCAPERSLNSLMHAG